MSTTPNMGLQLPVVSTTPGPEWASELNTALGLVDSHAHTGSDGVKLGTASFNINADLTLNSFSLIGINALELDNLLADLATPRAIYAVNGDLVYTNSSGVAVPITSGNSLAGFPGSITNLGAGTSSGLYNDTSKDLTFNFAPSKPMALNIGTIKLFPFDASALYSNYVKLQSPTALATSYDLTFPLALSGQDLPLSISTTGVLTPGLAAGSAAAPSMSFAGDLNTGIFNGNPDEMDFSTGGTTRFAVKSTGVYSVDGTSSLPAYSFIGDTDTGMYSSTGNEISFATNGTQAALITTDGLRTKPGATATPSYTFIGDTNTGMYSEGADQIGFTTGATLRSTITNFGLRTLDGSAATPSFSFLTQTDTGMYQAGGLLNLSSSGSIGATIAPSGIQTYASGVGGGFLRWKVFTGNIGPSGTATISAPTGVIVGATGWTQQDGGANWRHMSDVVVSAASAYNYYTVGTSTQTTIGITNGDTNSTNGYRITMFYQ